MALLEMNDITFRTAEREILSGLSLSITAGEVHALLGTNGTGKSTLAYLLMGCEGYLPTSGEIVFDGVLLNGLKIHERARLGISMAWRCSPRPSPSPTRSPERCAASPAPSRWVMATLRRTAGVSAGRAAARNAC